MATRTSWTGDITKRMQKKFRTKSLYTRYQDRRNKRGVEIVIPRGTLLEIRDVNGKFIRTEPKYQNFSGDDVSATKTYNSQRKKYFNERAQIVKKNQQRKQARQAIREARAKMRKRSRR